MKKVILFISFLAIASIIFFQFHACSKDAAKQKFAVPDFEGFMSEYNIGKFEQDKAMILQGKIHLGVTKQNNLIIWAEGENSSNNILYLQTDEKVTLNKTIENGKILVTPAYFIVSASDGSEVYLYQNSSYKVDDKFASLTPTRTFKGWGTIRMGNKEIYDRLVSQSSNIATRNALIEDAEPICKCVANGDSASCTAGGTGSTSCSKSNTSGNCTVSCSGGYYACCY